MHAQLFPLGLPGDFPRNSRLVLPHKNLNIDYFLTTRCLFARCVIAHPNTG